MKTKPYKLIICSFYVYRHTNILCCTKALCLKVILFILWRMQITWQFLNWFRKAVPPTYLYVCWLGKYLSPLLFFFFFLTLTAVICSVYKILKVQYSIKKQLFILKFAHWEGIYYLSIYNSIFNVFLKFLKF